MIISQVLISEQFLNIPRLYTAVAQWLSCCLFIFTVPKRFSKIYTFVITIISLFIFIGFHCWADTWHIKLWLLGMIISVLLIFLFIFLMTNKDFYHVACITVTAFIVSEFAASLEWQMEYFALTVLDQNLVGFLVYTPIEIYHLRITLFVIGVYIVIFYTIFSIERRYRITQRSIPFKLNDLMSALIIGISVFAFSNISFLGIITPITTNSPSEMFYIRTLVDFAGIILLYSQREHKYSTQKSFEIYTMQSILDKQIEQFQISKDSIDIVNQKYHDLKNHINVIRAETDYDKKMYYLDKLEESIKMYEKNYDTGNRILDIILNSKHDSILQNNINFTCVADGELLEFISVVDTVSIFGNLLDNAIESLKEIKDVEKRLMKLAIYAKADFIMVKVENYYQNILKYDNGSLLSTKGNTVYHGFGLKSIMRSAEKYKAAITINTEDHWFTVLILFPKLKNNIQI